jgi:hypothetical protein
MTEIHRFPRIEPKRTIINIRGCNGSGKTTLVKKFIKTMGAKPLYFPDKEKIQGYQVFFEPEVYVLGRYEKRLDGCDTYGTIEAVAQGVRDFADKGNVLFEGILVSILTKPWIKLAQSLPNTHFIFATLDTPADLCVERVRDRRKKMGIKGHYNPKNLLNKYKAVWHAHEVLKAAGMDARKLRYDYARPNLTNYFLEMEYGGKS